MRRLDWAVLALAAFAFWVGVALGQTGTVLMTSPAGTEEIAVTPVSPFPAGMNQSIALSQARDAVGFQKLVPTTGQTLAIPNNVSMIQLTPAGGLSALTFTTPTSPYNGQILRIFTTQSITTFNLTASAGQTVNGNLAGSLSANTDVGYVYSSSNTTWDRIH